MSTIAIVDDDNIIQRLLVSTMESDGYSTITASTAKDALDLLSAGNADALLLDLHLPDRTGIEIFNEIRRVDQRLPVIFMTGDESGDAVIEALRLGAFDYLTKPLDIERLRDVVERALESRRLMTSEVAIPFEGDDDGPQGEALIGRSPAMIEVFRAIAVCARQDVPVLVRGESGTGKELVARAVYQHGKRSGAKYLPVNCATLSENLLESELFGHEKGSFTGADRRHFGKFEQCDGGTIFLDEIGDTSPSVQAKLLRLLQQQEFQRLGGNETIRTDVRIISATNRPLEEMCENGEFRLDLFHRLNGFEIQLPALRDRGEDIERLVDHFLRLSLSSLDLPEFEGVAPSTLVILNNYSWPGNVRELQSTIRRALMNLRGPILLPESLPDILNQNPQMGADSTGHNEGTPGLDRFIQSRISGSQDLYAETITMVEEQLCRIVLEATNGNQSRASEILGITRGKLRSRIREFDIDVDQSRS